MNVAVIGKGTAAIITALKLLKDKHSVSIFYDPKIPHINVGESTTCPFGNLIWDTLGISIHDLVDINICSYKMGIEFVNWGSGKKFHHNFLHNSIAHHFETKDFNKFIHKYLEEKNLVTYIAQRVEDIFIVDDKVKIIDHEFDFVVNCAGWSNEKNYYEPLLETVNSVVLFRKNYEEYSSTHTLHLATEDGWQFGLPFPKQNIFKCGYLYNNKYVSKEEVLQKLPKDADVYESYNWKPKSCKYLIENNFIANNGNRLFFFEPLQAMTLHYSIDFAQLICDYLKDRSQYNMDRINYSYHDHIYSQQLCLAYHYQFGSIHDTSFWKDITKKSKSIVEYSPMGSGERFLESVQYDLKYKNEVSKMAWMIAQDHVYLQNGFSGNPSSAVGPLKDFI